ncbi:YopX family protein [Pediococcus acidilactici]|uniref:YopX family protein n=1 Tax=Pediococcus acidilactici TaxID=1254 RepID=UPI002022E01C|nr:YopX family protein [Pediococcus acidilactici]
MIVSVEDLIDTSDMKMTDEEIYQSLVELGYIEEGGLTMIKFRAWDNSIKAYLYNVQDAYDTLSGFVKYDDGKDADYDECCFGDFLDNKRYDVEQFTGLKDVNGKEIYEGDIIEFFGANKKIKAKNEFGIIVYKADRYGAGFNSIIQNKEHGYGGINIAQDIVVGNVHENPELLKE